MCRSSISYPHTPKASLLSLQGIYRRCGDQAPKASDEVILGCLGRVTGFALMPDEHTSSSRRRTMSKKLEGKIALITGGSRGIGAAIAKRLAADGAKVTITYTKGAEAAAAVVKEIEQAGGKAIALQADATDAKAVKTAIEKTVATFGRLDVLVNNAGTAIPKPFEEATLEELDHVIDLNLRGVFIATQAALKHIGNGGRVIMIGSCVGERNMTPGLAAYAATKGAVKMFTQGLARED